MKITLRAARVNNCLTLVGVADMLGISISTLRGYENGTAYPRVDVAFKLAKIYGCSIDNLDFLCSGDSSKAN